MTVFYGGNFAVRREALDRIGGFDTSIECHGEDTISDAGCLPSARSVCFTTASCMPCSRAQSSGTPNRVGHGRMPRGLLGGLSLA